MLFYPVIDKDRIYFSPDPEVDKYLRGHISVAIKAPLVTLMRIVEELIDHKQVDISPKNIDRLTQVISARLLKETDATSKTLLFPLKGESSNLKESLTDSERFLLSDEVGYNHFLQLVEGRQFTENELVWIQRYLKLEERALLILIQKTVINEIGYWVPAFKRFNKQWQCQRCGSYQYKEWPSVFGKAVTCLGCEKLGPLNSLQAIFRCKALKQEYQVEYKPEILKPVYKTHISKDRLEEEKLDSDFCFGFTPYQREVTQRLLSFSRQGEYREILIWAACGAGKTEVSFPLIKEYLEAGKKVLFAAPRQDVVHDVQARLQKNFPNQKVKVLSGAVSHSLEPSPLIVATTHQLLRFYRCFDLIIFDEIDAYPYAGNSILEYGLRHAIKEKGQLVYLTATPSDEILLRIGRGECAMIRLAMRYHGYPVPVPEWSKIKVPEVVDNSVQKGKHRRYKLLFNLLKELAQNGPLLIFVPTISKVEPWVKELRLIFEDKEIEGSWSSDPARGMKVNAFLKGHSNIFVCTSILERGVTINRVQVVVLYADHELYDTRSLVQMAGRTGRTTECPVGKAIFVAPRQTKAIQQAIKWITEQNTLGQGENNNG